MSGNEPTEDKGHGDGSHQPNQHGGLEPYRPQPDSVAAPPSGQQWCYCGSVPPSTIPFGAVCAQYNIIPTIDSQLRSDHPTHVGHRASTEDKGHQGAGSVEMQFNPPGPQQWYGYPHCGYLPMPPLCYCCNTPPHHHPGGMVYLPYPNIPPGDNRSKPDHPTHGGQVAISVKYKEHHAAAKVGLQNTVQLQPPAPQPWSENPQSGYLPVPPFCYCDNTPPHRHPGGIVYMSYPNSPPINSQPRIEHPSSGDDSGHRGAVRSQMHHTTQHMQPNPPAPQPWSGYPVPTLCYCGNIPPHHHPNGMVYLPYPNKPPTDSQPSTEHLQHVDQQPPSMEEDKPHHGAAMVEMLHAIQMKPPVPQPWNNYPYGGYLPVPPLCYCGQLPPHHHPNGMVYMSYPGSPPVDSQPRTEHLNDDGQHPSSTDEAGHQGAVTGQMHHITQPMQSIPPIPSWHGYPHCGYLPAPQFCYCGNIPPHHHAGGVVYLPQPSIPPADSQPRLQHPNHGGQYPAAMDDKGHQGSGNVEKQHVLHQLQQMQPCPSLPQPWNGYPHCGCLTVPPICYCCKLPPHHHPGGLVHAPCPHVPPTDCQP